MMRCFAGLIVFSTILFASSLLSVGHAMMCVGFCGGQEGHKGTVTAHEGHKGHTKGVSKEQTKGDVETKYTCPMHPEVVSDKPGKCPKCGMDLEEKKVEKKTKVSYFEETKYTCPMHLEVVSDKPGKCPKCGMELEKKESKTFSYFCPQKHCKYKSSEPGKCPEHKKGLVTTEVTLHCAGTDAELQIKDGKLSCPKCKMEIKPENAKVKKK